jgi:ABC-type spermidine/putrescine transport system permease subunit I
MAHPTITIAPEDDKPTFRERFAQKGLPLLFVLPAALLFLFAFILPMLVALRYSMLSTMPFWDPNPKITFANYVRVFAEPIYLRAFWRTALYAGGSTAISLLISYPAAYYLARISRRPAQSCGFSPGK